MKLQKSNKFNQILALVLVLTMVMPHIAFASELPWGEGIGSAGNVGSVGNIGENDLFDFTMPSPPDYVSYSELRLNALLEQIHNFDTFTAEEQRMVSEHLGMNIFDPTAELPPEELEAFLRAQEAYAAEDWVVRERARFW